jgi:hypothetical protein
MNTEGTTTTAGPPYMSWGSLENLIERMSKDGIPGRIDRSVLAGSEGAKTQVLAGLRWLELIELDGSVTATFEQLVKGSDRQALIGKLFREKYAEQVALGERNASQRELEESFHPYGGETARKAASFYLKGAKFAGLPTSSYFKVPRTRRARSGGKTASRATKTTGVGATQTTETLSNGLHPAVAGLLNDLPREGAGWPSPEARQEFLDTFEALVKYAIPVTGDATPEPESEEGNEE